MDDFTLGLLTNDEVLDVDQDPLGKPGRTGSRRTAMLEVWARPLEDGSLAVGLFNRGEGMKSDSRGLEGSRPRRAADRARPVAQKDIGA